MAAFELDPAQSTATPQASAGKEGLGGTVLLSNARWFTMVRWIAVAIFAVVAAVFTLLPGFFRRIGAVPAGPQFWGLSAYLAIANTLLILFVRRLDERSGLQSVKTHMWGQIIVDLLAVTYLVHTVGSVETFVAFAFLFHIALTCVFFNARESLLVVLAAALLYLGSVLLELFRIWPSAGILHGRTDLVAHSPTLAFLFALSAVFVWLVIWYFISTLSGTVRAREADLRRANRALGAANEEKNRIMLVTAHDLKAPFSGIESNIAFLRTEHWKALPEAVRHVVERIETRSKTLRERINAILLLGELRSVSGTAGESAGRTDLRTIMNTVIEEVRERADARGITVEIDVPEIAVPGTARQYSILFLNIVANAITYSHDGGHVSVRARSAGEIAVVTVTDNGIGIREDALPHIFDEYYRTREATRFNKLSTGLGLAIVKEIAAQAGLRIRVTSEEKMGTTFAVEIPIRAA